MRRGAFAYQSSDADDELGVLADAAKGAAARAGAAIDEALHFIDASNKRIWRQSMTLPIACDLTRNGVRNMTSARG